jgi:hypothetical protein
MRCSKALTPLVTGLTILVLSSEAFADTAEENKPPAVRRHRPSQILMRSQEPRGEVTGSWMENITVRKGMGLAYRYKFETEDHHKMVLNLGGPIVKKKRLGLMFEIRF